MSRPTRISIPPHLEAMDLRTLAEEPMFSDPTEDPWRGLSVLTVLEFVAWWRYAERGTLTRPIVVLSESTWATLQSVCGPMLTAPEDGPCKLNPYAPDGALVYFDGYNGLLAIRNVYEASNAHTDSGSGPKEA